MIWLFVGFALGAVAGMLVMAFLASNAYEKGGQDMLEAIDARKTFGER